MASCRWGLDELPVFDEANITSINFETRWVDPQTNSFRVQQLTVTNLAIDPTENTIEFKLVVPAQSSTFPSDVRSQVALNKLVMICNISNAATIKPIGTTPVPGTIGDFSQSNLNYEVIAADGKTKKEWTIKILEFIKQ